MDEKLKETMRSVLKKRGIDRAVWQEMLLGDLRNAKESLAELIAVTVKPRKLSELKRAGEYIDLVMSLVVRDREAELKAEALLKGGNEHGEKGEEEKQGV